MDIPTAALCHQADMRLSEALKICASFALTFQEISSRKSTWKTKCEARIWDPGRSALRAATRNHGTSADGRVGTVHASVTAEVRRTVCKNTSKCIPIEARSHGLSTAA